MISITVRNSKENPSNIIKLYDSIRTFMPRSKIIIHDSNSPDLSYITELQAEVFPKHQHALDRTILKMYNKNYVDSSVWNTYQLFPNEEYYWFLHDSMELKADLKPLEVNKFNSYMYFDKCYDSDEQKRYVVDSLNKIGINESEYKKGLFGITFGCNKATLNQLYNTGVNDLLPSNKLEMMGSERIYGAVLNHIMVNIEENSINGDFFDRKESCDNHSILNKYFQNRA